MRQLKELIEDHLSEIEYLKGILRRGPRVESVKKDGGQERPSPYYLGPIDAHGHDAEQPRVQA
jgi:hypothetical protein